MRHSIPSPDNTSSNELKRSFWDDFEHKTFLPTKEQHKTSSRTSQKRLKPKKKSRWPTSPHGTGADTTEPGSPTKKRLWWYKRSWHANTVTTQASQRSTTYQWDRWETSWKNTMSRHDRYRRYKAHAFVDERRKKVLNKRNKRVKSRLQNKYSFYQHPREQMYEYIAKQMNIECKDCHFKKFNAEQCIQAMEISKTFIYSYKIIHA